jgi:hypothetical protein
MLRRMEESIGNNFILWIEKALPRQEPTVPTGAQDASMKDSLADLQNLEFEKDRCKFNEHADPENTRFANVL